eukprot:Clim_evm7s211 gene=Clim_evmTU7s211
MEEADHAQIMGGGSSADCVSRVELTFSCEKLLDKDTLSKSDPQVIVYEKRTGPQGQESWKELGRTEMVKDNLNPEFKKEVLVDYRFEEIQHMRFLVVDVDKEGGTVREQDYLGERLVTLSEIICCPNSKARYMLMKPGKGKNDDAGKRGHITIHAHEVKNVAYTVHMLLTGSGLDKKDTFGKSDPYVEIFRKNKDGEWVKIFKSEKIKKTLNPRWARISMSASRLCFGDWTTPLRFEVFDYDKSSDPDLIGVCETNLEELGQMGAGAYKELINPKKQAKKGSKYKNSGVLNFTSIEYEKKPTLIEYLQGGCEINLAMAIDFTASNGNPANPQSLHHLNMQRMNEYQAAIHTVGNVLEPYDKDHWIPAFGFGAVPPNATQVSHCFPLTFDTQQFYCHGIRGVLSQYANALPRVRLSGPTFFSQILDAFKAAATHNGPVSQKNQHYVVGLIITDGVINDMQPSIDRIIEASGLPLSIIIVGVGAADFSQMEHLDADDTPLRGSKGQKPERDIVQFVPFRQTASFGPDGLAREVLAEVPGQFLQFMKKHGIEPNPPPAAEAFYNEDAHRDSGVASNGGDELYQKAG